uniref:Uncharacterized protein n=1 Tax=Hucho hucho TaxID=62062 RepID=A0A4W5LWW6_9TELE
MSQAQQLNTSLPSSPPSSLLSSPPPFLISPLHPLSVDGVDSVGPGHSCSPSVFPFPRRARPELGGLFQKEKGSQRASDIYFVLLAWAFVLVQVWLNLWMLQLLPIPVAVWVLKKLVVRFGLKRFAEKTLSSWWVGLEKFGSERQDAIMPGPIKGLVQFLLRVDTKVMACPPGPTP